MMTAQQAEDARTAAKVFIRLANSLRKSYKDSITTQELEAMARALIVRAKKQEA